MAGVAAIGIISALTATASAVESNQDRIAAVKEGDQQKDAQEQALNQAKTVQTNQQGVLDANNVRNQQRAALQANANSSQGRSGTILTSPLGVTGNPPQTSNKTIIGA